VQKERERKNILLYYKALIFLELFFIQAAVFVRKTHNLKFSVLKNFLVHSLTPSTRFLSDSRSGRNFLYIHFLCVYYFQPRECCIVLYCWRKLKN
jgi:hypothetical protein